jgi:hypothetical protein
MLDIKIAQRFLAFLTFSSLLTTNGQSQAAGSSAENGGTAPSSGKTSKVLKGSAQHAQSLNPSVRLLSPSAVMAAPRTPNAYSGRAQYPQRPFYYIPNAPAAHFHREHHNSLPPRDLIAVPPPAKSGPAPAVAASNLATNGIMTWAPGYASTRIPLSTEASVHGVLQGDRGLAARPLVAQFRSTPRLLTELLAPQAKRCENWDDWYKQVCKTVYDQWLIDQTGPGKACIHVTVWSTRDLECKIVDFSPAPGTSRDVAQETKFREAALQSVRSLDRCSVLEFPTRFVGRMVSFDLDISRAVDGPFGCEVVAAHGSENSVNR